MMSMFAILIPFALVVILPVFFLVWKGKSKYFSVKITHWLLIVYTGVLLLSLIVVSIMKMEEPIVIEGGGVDLYEALNHKKISELPPENILVEETFEVEGNLLRIAARHSPYGTDVFLKRKEGLEGTIKLVVLGHGPITGNMDFSKEFIPPGIRLEGDTLTITYPEFQEINAAIIKKEFTINQFTGDSMMNNNINFEPPMYYLEVPEDMELEPSPDIYIH